MFDILWYPQIGSSQGKGIFLFDRLSQINDWRNDSKWKPEDQQAEKYIVQRLGENMQTCMDDIQIKRSYTIYSIYIVYAVE